MARLILNLGLVRKLQEILESDELEQMSLPNKLMPLSNLTIITCVGRE